MTGLKLSAAEQYGAGATASGGAVRAGPYRVIAHADSNHILIPYLFLSAEHHGACVPAGGGAICFVHI